MFVYWPFNIYELVLLGEIFKKKVAFFVFFVLFSFFQGAVVENEKTDL